MLTAMANAAVGAVPPGAATHIPAVLGVLSMPLSLLFDPDSFYLGALPVIAEVASALGVPPIQVGQAALLGQMTTGFPVSPLTPATFLVVGSEWNRAGRASALHCAVSLHRLAADDRRVHRAWSVSAVTCRPSRGLRRDGVLGSAAALATPAIASSRRWSWPRKESSTISCSSASPSARLDSRSKQGQGSGGGLRSAVARSHDRRSARLRRSRRSSDHEHGRGQSARGGESGGATRATARTEHGAHRGGHWRRCARVRSRVETIRSTRRAAPWGVAGDARLGERVSRRRTAAGGARRRMQM